MTIAPHRPDAPSPPLTNRDDDHELVVIRQDPETGLRLIVAVHSTALGPALGGMRLRAYPRGLTDALADAMALARTMTLKASAVGLELGGGKAVMIDDGRDDLRTGRLGAAGRVIDELGGDYITAEDIGTTTADMDVIAQHTRYVVGRAPESGGAGDPSPVTARTVQRAIRCGLRAATGSDSLDGRRVGVIGLGKVGHALAAGLAAEGARVVACDLREEVTERFVAEHGGEAALSAEGVMARELDVLAPCAAGGMIDEVIAGGLDVRVVCGAANNPLTGRDVATALARRGILYVPDFLANCGGLIHVDADWRGYSEERVDAGIERAMTNLQHAIEAAAAGGETPLAVAEREALARVANARGSLPAGK